MLHQLWRRPQKDPHCLSIDLLVAVPIVFSSLKSTGVKTERHGYLTSEGIYLSEHDHFPAYTAQRLQIDLRPDALTQREVVHDTLAHINQTDTLQCRLIED